MKAQMKRLLLFALCAALLAVCGVFAFAAKETGPIIVDHIVYQLIPARGKAAAHYEVISLFDSEDAMRGVTEITVPAAVKGIPVTAISCDSNYIGLYADSEVETVRLPETMETIGRRAFAYWNNLKEIEIPAGVKTIGPQSFARCKNLSRVRFLGDKLETIEKATFYRCTALQYIDLPASLRSIAQQAFFRSGLRSVRIPGGCALNGAFCSAEKLKKVVFEDRTDNYPAFLSGAFADCRNLRKVYLPKNAPAFTIYAGTFSGCRKLKAVYHMEHVKIIWDSAFDRCESLTSLTLPAGLEMITYNALIGCAGLKKLRVLTEDASVFVNHMEHGNCLQNLPQDCKVYVKTKTAQQAFLDAGCTNQIIVKADLK